MDYQITVCDPREEYAAQWDVAGVAISCDMPDEAIDVMRPDQRSAVLALSHDRKLDDMALIEALVSPAFYVGAIGSRASQAARRERLQLFNLTGQQIARLHGPVGFDIGSKTPAEIAVSILAEMTAVKHGVSTHVAMRFSEGA